MNGEILAEAIDEDFGFRNLSSPETKGFNIMKRDQQLQLVFALWLKNGFAKRLVGIPIDFIFGDSLYSPDVKSKDNSISDDTLKELEEILTNFIKQNKLKNKFEKFYTDLSINGTLILPAAVNQYNGNVTVGFIDPSKLEKAETNPYDVTDVILLQMKRDFKGEKKQLEVIRTKSAFEDPESNDYNLLSGDTFFYSINNVSNQPEGVSDLLADADMIEILYHLIISVAEGANLSNMFILDVELKGASEDQINKWKKNNPIPKKPTRLVHNEKVEQKAVNPGVNPGNQAETIRTIKNIVLGNWSYPPMWFADGQDANRAIAVEQGTPIFKKLKKRQDLVIEILESLYTFALHSAIKFKEGIKLSQEQINSLEIEIKSPEIETKNVDNISNVLKNLVESLDKAEVKKWISYESSRKSFLEILNYFGMNIDVQSEEAKIDDSIKIRLICKIISGIITLVTLVVNVISIIVNYDQTIDFFNRILGK